MSSSEENDKKPCHWYEDKWEWEKYKDRIVRQINDQSEKVKYNPEKGTNWCNLPVEAKLKCIGKMDFLSLYKLKNTSKTEKSLVSCKAEMNFEVVQLDLGCEIEGIFRKKKDKLNQPDYKFNGEAGNISFKKALRDIAVLLKMSTVDTLEIFYGGGFREMPEIFEMLAPFRIRQIVSDSICDPIFFKPHNFFIENCEPNVETFILYSNCKIALPSVMNEKFPKSLKFLMDDAVEANVDLYIKDWLSSLATGTKIQFCFKDNFNFDDALAQLQHREISSSDSERRYSTEDAEKELILKIHNSIGYPNKPAPSFNKSLSFKIVQPKNIEKKPKKRTHAQSSSAGNN